MLTSIKYFFNTRELKKNVYWIEVIHKCLKARSMCQVYPLAHSIDQLSIIKIWNKFFDPEQKHYIFYFLTFHNRKGTKYLKEIIVMNKAENKPNQVNNSLELDSTINLLNLVHESNELNLSWKLSLLNKWGRLELYIVRLGWFTSWLDNIYTFF